MRGWTIVLLGLVVTTGCSEEPASVGPGTGGGQAGGGAGAPSCPDGEVEVGHGLCSPCAPGSLELADGSCQPAGVLECGDGFVHDGGVGCDALLPAGACPAGEMARPGEATCREIAPCGSGTWGDIVTDATTQYVDAGYSGGNSDGSMLAPWTKIQQAINAAASGAVIAVAAGSYLEDLTLSAPITLWGRCPSMVEVVGSGAFVTTLHVSSGASGSVVRGMAIRGPGVGVAVRADSSLEQLWIHDNGDRGVDVWSVSGPVSVVVRGSLLENNVDHGIVVTAATATIEDCVMRANQPLGALPGRGMAGQSDPMTGAASSITVTRSLFELNHEGGIGLFGGDTTIDSSVVRRTELGTQGLFGRGLNVQPEVLTDVPADVTVTRSSVEWSRDAGIFVAASSLSVQDTVVRDTEPDGGGRFGRGIVVQTHPILGTAGTLVVERSLVERSADPHVFSWGSDATLEATVFRDGAGHGIAIEADSDSGTSGALTIRGCSVRGSRGTGVFAAGAVTTIDLTAIVGSGTAGDDVARGVSAQRFVDTSTSLTLTRSLIEQHRGIAVGLLDAAGTVDGVTVRDTAVDALGNAGDAFGVVSELGFGELTLQHTVTDSSARAAIFNLRGSVSLSDSRFTCQLFDFDGETGTGSAYEFVDQGGNRCGCPVATDDCRVVSSGLAPPPPLEVLDKSN